MSPALTQLWELLCWFHRVLLMLQGSPVSHGRATCEEEKAPEA
jgi:hypothetical protein